MKHILLLFWLSPYIMCWKLGPANYKAKVIIMDKEKTIGTAAEPEVKKRGGRKPMTAEEKASAAKARAESKAKADSLRPTVLCSSRAARWSLTRW